MASTRFQRRLALFLTPLALIAIGLLAAWKLMNTPPAWASRRISSESQTHHADQRLLDAVNWTSDAQRRRTMPAAAALPPLPPLEITFSQEDLDAFFDQCNAQFGWLGDGTDPSEPTAGIVLESDRLILAVTPGGGGSILSVQFQPTLVEGKLLVPVARVQKGILPVPAALWRAWRNGMVDQLRKQLPAESARAAIARDGSANASLMQAQTLRLLIDVLENRPAEPIVFFPYIQDFRRHFLPVRLTEIQIVDHELSLKARPLDRDESAALLARIRANAD